jgi:hypothetical protein
MTVYWLSYRIEEDDTGDERRRALLEMVDLYATSNSVWHETTSFVVFDSDRGIDTLSGQFKLAIDPKKDHFLIRRMDSQAARICGHIKDIRIFQLMLDKNGKTYLKQVP